MPSSAERLKSNLPIHYSSPTPVITCWGTCSNAIVYYSESSETFSFVVNELDRDDATSNEIMHEIFNDR
jgi:hypothetical protein